MPERASERARAVGIRTKFDACQSERASERERWGRAEQRRGAVQCRKGQFLRRNRPVDSIRFRCFRSFDRSFRRVGKTSEISFVLLLTHDRSAAFLIWALVFRAVYRPKIAKTVSNRTNCKRLKRVRLRIANREITNCEQPKNPRI